MRIYADTVTSRLEEIALELGVSCQIRKIEAHQEGRFFVVMVDDVPLKWPVAIGFTESQAQYALKRRTWERYAVRGGPLSLKPTRRGSAGGRPSKRRRYPW